MAIPFPASRQLSAGLLALLAWLALACAAHAAPPLVLADPGISTGAGLHLSYFNDRARTCDLDCARGRFAGGPVLRSQAQTPNLGVTGAWWFHLRLRNDTPATDWVASIASPYLDEVDLYVVRADGHVDHTSTGDYRPTRERPIVARMLALPLALAPGEQVDVYIRNYNRGPVNMPLAFETRQHFSDGLAGDYLAHGIYFGILLAVLLYNLVIFVIIRDISHVLYAAYVGAFALTMFTVFGFSAIHVWPDWPWLINRAVPLSVVVTGSLVLLFTRSFLRLPPGDWRDRVMIGVLALLGLFTPVALFAPFDVAVRIIYVYSVVAVLWLLFLGIEQVMRGNRSARYFMLAWIVLLVMLVIFMLTKLGILPSNALTENGILFGSAAEAILLSIALAHRFALIREDSERIQREAAAELERRVDERTRELDSALQARSEFLATVSHEIRTPMNGVLGIAELMQDTPLDARQQEYLRIIQGSGRTLLTIINDVLDYSKIEAGRMTLEAAPFRIRDVLNAAIQVFRAEAQRKHLRFLTAIDDDVPEEVIGDAVRLQQVLNNLLSNAVKFTGSGEIRLAVHRETGGRLTFSVSDTGPGIPPSVQPRLFEAFFQGDPSASRRHSGTGLGLPISRRLVELMGGTISFESSEGLGSTFYFTIPIRTGNSGAWQQVRGGDTARLRALRLLVVDDNLVNLQVAAGLLRKLGHTVETVDNATEALARLSGVGDGYDAVFMDCEMPVMDGFEATRRIRAREQAEGLSHLPVIALTAHAFAEKIEACRRSGMDDHLAKPLNMRALEETLVRVLGGSRAG